MRIFQRNCRQTELLSHLTGVGIPTSILLIWGTTKESFVRFEAFSPP